MSPPASTTGLGEALRPVAAPMTDSPKEWNVAAVRPTDDAGCLEALLDATLELGGASPC